MCFGRRDERMLWNLVAAVAILVLGSLFTAMVSGCKGEAGPPPPLVITSSAPPTGTTQTAYGANGSGFSFTAAGGVAPYTWSWAAATGSLLPPGLKVSSGSISGRPTTAGSFQVVVTVTDSGTPAAQMSANYTMAIASSVGLGITSGPPPDGTAGVNYSPVTTYCLNGSPGCKCVDPILGKCRRVTFGFDLRATGGASPYTWSWTAGAGSSLPNGLGLSSSGHLGGIPSMGGSYTVIVTLADAGSPPAQTDASYTIVIDNPPPPTINTLLPPIGTLSAPYTLVFTAKDGLPPFVWTETGAMPPGLMFDSATGTLSGTPTAAGQFPITVKVTDSAGRDSAPYNLSIQVLATGFKPTDSMGTAREGHRATLLCDLSSLPCNNPKVLVTGGGSATAELYDPASGSFTATGSMEMSRMFHTATLLKDGKVLVTGGQDSSGNPSATAEVYDPATGKFMATGSLITGRFNHTATLLAGGRVLVTGGEDLSSGSDTGLATAELYDPATGTFSLTAGSMNTARTYQTATLLNSGKVLVAGGSVLTGNGSTSFVTPTAELYDPATGTFTLTGSMGNARVNHTATLLSNGKVVVMGGGADPAAIAAGAELFDPATGSFSTTGSTVIPRSFHAAELLADGTVLVAGGYNGGVLSAAEVFDPVAGTFTSTADMTTARFRHTATRLASGEVLVTGGIGSDRSSSLASAELYH